MANVRTGENTVQRSVRKKASPELSIVKDGYRYVLVLLSVWRSARSWP